MSYLIHAGPRAAWQARERAWPTVYRFIAAKNLVRTVYGYAPFDAVSALEARLRFLEKENVIRIHGSMIYASDKEVGFGFGRSGLIDVNRTAVYVYPGSHAFLR